MKDSLEVGIETTATRKVAADEIAHMPVLSTPAMIGAIEGVCSTLMRPYLDEGEASVGTHVCVSHVGAASVGDEFTITARLTGREGRRLTFEVAVHGPKGVMSEGTHQRTVIDPSRYRR